MFLSISFVLIILTFRLNLYLTNSLNDDDGVEIAEVNEYGDEVPEHLDRVQRDTDSVLKEYIKNLKNVSTTNENKNSNNLIVI